MIIQWVIVLHKDVPVFIDAPRKFHKKDIVNTFPKYVTR